MKSLYEDLPPVEIAGRKFVGRVLFGLLVLVQLVVGLVWLARRYRAGLPLLTWAGLLVTVFVLGAARGNYYSGFKLLAHTYFIVLLGVAAVLFASSPRWCLLGSMVVVLWLGLAGYATTRIVPLARQRGAYNE